MMGHTQMRFNIVERAAEAAYLLDEEMSEIKDEIQELKVLHAKTC